MSYYCFATAQIGLTVWEYMHHARIGYTPCSEWAEQFKHIFEELLAKSYSGGKLVE